MISRVVYVIMLAGAAVTTAPAPVTAQTGVLSYYPGARSAALAGSGVGDASDPTTIWHNPASAALVDGVYGFVSAGNITGDWPERRFAAVAISSGGVPYQRSGFAVALGGDLRYEDQNRGGHYASATLGVDITTWSVLHVGLGATYKALQTDPLYLTHEEEKTSLHDIGGRVALVRTRSSGRRVEVSFGYSRRNEGADTPYVSWFIYPMEVAGFSVATASPARAGEGEEASSSSLRLNVDVLRELDKPNHVAVTGGVDLGITERVDVRFGLGGGAPTIGLGLGGMIRQIRLRTDFAVAVSSSNQSYPAFLTLLAGWQR